MLQKMCRSLQARVPEHLAAVREALHSRDACVYGKRLTNSVACFRRSRRLPAIRRPIWKTPRPAGSLTEAQPIVAQLETIAGELLERVDGLSIESLRHQAE